MSTCGSGLIQWHQFDWQSFSTLVTGILAVSAATVVGWKQTLIARRQTEILHRQTELEEAKLKADLFTRRFETYEATKDFVLHISDLPEVDPDGECRIQRFNLKMRESRFLFSDPTIYRTLLTYWEKGNSARVDRAISISDYQDGVKRDNERTERLLSYPIWSLKTVETLADLFSRDLAIIKDHRP